MNTKIIPFLSSNTTLSEQVKQFLDILAQKGFKGDIELDLARRLVAATDNSVYQVLPQALLYPYHVQDIELIGGLLTQTEYRSIQIAPRGGGTGTNGQSLTHGLVVDLSRYMNSILELNLNEEWVEVEAGVVLDQLNDELIKYGYFFAPNLSPSSRATIGGMINTDAAGKGSRVYGKTSDHILALDLVQLGRSAYTLRETSLEVIKLKAQENENCFEATIALPLVKLAEEYEEKIEQTFPKLSRFMTGYNLKMFFHKEKQTLDLTRLVSGSEGTLGIVSKARLKLTKIPTERQLILFSYSTFQDALGSAQLLLAQDPSAIETIDHNILSLARADVSYHEVKEALESNGQEPSTIMAINLVEFEGVSKTEVEERVQQCLNSLRPLYGQINTPVADYVAVSIEDQKALWGLRKKGVGLLAARPGKRKPIAFVEDTVVPPEKLSAYIKEFTKLLDQEGVEYGLFGHVDVGCLHVRPALDLRDPEDEKKFLRISDKVSTLVRSYGGLIWGEHGKGIRSAYSPDFFGELYPALQAVKYLFDPYNQLNPGKVATPDDQSDLMPLNSPLRAHQDRLISTNNLKGFEVTVTCNGNGQCFDYHPHHLMCPSSKATRDRLHSPKGRATVMRAWLTSLSKAQFSLEPASYEPLHIEIVQARGYKKWLSPLKTAMIAPIRMIQKQIWAKHQKTDFSTQVQEAMSGCLSCKACTTACPVKVDVPSFKARFLHLYYQRYPRPLRDYLIGSLESLASYATHVSWLWNMSLRLPVVALINRTFFRMADPPHLSPKSGLKLLKQQGCQLAEKERLANLSEEEKSKAVILIPDAFNSFFDAETLVSSYQVLTILGFTVFLAPFYPNGKGYHVKGRLTSFKQVAQGNVNKLKYLNTLGIPMVCIDPAVALTYRDEYVEAFGREEIKVLLVQEWLLSRLSSLPKVNIKEKPAVDLYAHCTERSLVTSSQQDWYLIFERLGISCTPQTHGCCGMCGVFGHESEHVEQSKQIYQESWLKQLQNTRDNQRIPVVTGYSCRSQIKRCSPEIKNAQHPLAVLAKYLKNEVV